MLRNPAYTGRACFAKTTRAPRQRGRNRTARLAGRATPTAYTVTDQPGEDWLEIPVATLVRQDTFALAQRRLADNKHFATRNTKVPSLLQGLTACSGCGYAYYRTSTRTTNKKIYYYRCLGSDDYRYEHGRVCDNKPVRADHLDDVVWTHISELLADPALIRTEIDRRLAQLRTADPTTARQQRLETALVKTTASITRLIAAYQDDLISLDELRARTPELRARETSLRSELDNLADQLVDGEVYLKLAENLEDFLTQLRDTTSTATVEQRQRVLRLLVKEILIGPEQIVIRHAIPTRGDTTRRARHEGHSDADPDPDPGCPLRGRSPVPVAVQRGAVGPGRAPRPGPRRPAVQQCGTGQAPPSRSSELPPGAVRRRLCATNAEGWPASSTAPSPRPWLPPPSGNARGFSSSTHRRARNGRRSP